MDGALIEDAISRGSANFNNLAKRVLLSDRLIIQNLNKFSFIGIINVLNFQYLKMGTINRIIFYAKQVRKVRRTAFLTILEEIITNQKVDDLFLHTYKNQINWDIVCRHQELSKDILFIYFNRFQVRDLIVFQNLPIELIEEYLHLMDVELLSEYQCLNEPFIEKNINRINMMKLGENFQFSSQFMIKYKYKLNIELLCKTQTIDDHVLRDFISNNLNVCFDTISWRQDLSEDFIREYFMLLDKDDIVSFQKLSEKFMEDMWDHLNIELLSSHQRISYSFFRLHKYDLYMTDNIELTIKNGHSILALKLTGVFNSDILSLIETYL